MQPQSHALLFGWTFTMSASTDKSTNEMGFAVLTYVCAYMVLKTMISYLVLCK